MQVSMSEKLINFPWKRRSNKTDPYDFVQLFEKETIIPMRSYCNDSIIETAKGRYDVRTSMVKREFEEVPANPTIARLMKQCLKDRYLCDIGLLVTGTHAKVGAVSSRMRLTDFLNRWSHTCAIPIDFEPISILESKIFDTFGIVLILVLKRTPLGY